MTITPNIDIVIAGAGIAGLTAAIEARRNGRSVVVLEASGRGGGVIETRRNGRFILENGPNTVLSTPPLLDLVKYVGLENQVCFAPPRLPRYVLKNGTLHPIPLGPVSFLRTPLLSAAGKMRIFLEPFVPVNRTDDESLSAFSRRRFGRDVLDNLIRPFISGVWAGDADHLSAASALPKLNEWEQKKGSVIKGAFGSRNEKPPSLMSFENGLETLPQACAKILGDDLRTDSPIDRIARHRTESGERRWMIESKSNRYIASRLVLALPAFAAAPLLRKELPPASSALRDIPYAGAAVLHFSADTSDIRHPLDGFGFLTRPSENPDLLGCLFSSRLFADRAPDGQALLTVFMGGATRPDLLSDSEETLARKAEDLLRPLLGVNGPLRLLSIKTIPRAIPQYIIGHRHRVETLQKIERDDPGIRFIGSYRGGISVGDVVKNARGICSSSEKEASTSKGSPSNFPRNLSERK